MYVRSQVINFPICTTMLREFGMLWLKYGRMKIKKCVCTIYVWNWPSRGKWIMIGCGPYISCSYEGGSGRSLPLFFGKVGSQQKGWKGVTTSKYWGSAGSNGPYVQVSEAHNIRIKGRESENKNATEFLLRGHT